MGITVCNAPVSTKPTKERDRDISGLYAMKGVLKIPTSPPMVVPGSISG